MSSRPLATYHTDSTAALGSALVYAATAGGVAALAVAVFSAPIESFGAEQSLRYWLAGGVGAVAFLGAFWYAYRNAESGTYEVFDERIRMTMNGFQTDSAEVELEQVERIEYRETRIDRLAGSGSVVIERCGDADPYLLSHVEDAEELRDRLREATGAAESGRR